MPKIMAIAAMDKNRVIGHAGKLPWNCPADMRHFKDLTMGHTVLMGRKTYDSLPSKFRPLPGRHNIVVSSKENFDSAVEVWSELDLNLQKFKAGDLRLGTDLLWIIGGSQLYQATQKYWDGVELSIVDGVYQGDAYFPEFESDFDLLSLKSDQGVEFLSYLRK